MPRQSPVANGLLSELVKSEFALRVAERKLSQVQAEFDVEARKYAAIRDATAAVLGVSPYDPTVVWPVQPRMNDQNIARRARGRFRFVYVPMGVAVVSVLSDADEPRTLEEIQDVLIKGGATIDSLRVINATLMGLVKGNAVVRLDDGRYVRRMPDEKEAGGETEE